MAYLLCIETATEICSVALFNDKQLCASEMNAEGNKHAAVLTLLIDACLQKAGIQKTQLDAVGLSKGPGSYTGLRVGTSTAKGICYALDIPLITVNTLAALTAYYLQTHTVSGGLICPMIDARRMEVYTALFNQQHQTILATEAKIIDEKSFESELNQQPIYFIGNGAAKCANVIQHPNAIFVHDVFCNAAGLIDEGLMAYQEKRFDDLAYFEPFYLKDFVGTTPKNKL